MPLRRIFTEQTLEPGQSIALEPGPVHHLKRVLRQRKGAEILLFNGDGRDYRGIVRSAQGDTVVVEVTESRQAIPESPVAVTLVQAIGKGERMDFCIQKATELGVTDIQPVFSERVEVRLSGRRLENRLRHWRHVIVGACEQSGRAVIPGLGRPVSLTCWLGGGISGQCRVLHPGAKTSLLEGMSALHPVTLLVGPEGGFSDSEIRALQSGGVLPVRFGRRILRTETAGPAAIAVVQAFLGGLD